MTALGLTCLLLAIVAVWLLIRNRRHRRALRTVDELTKQLHRIVGQASGDLSGRVWVETTDPAVLSIKTDVNQLLSRHGSAPPQQVSHTELFGELADRVHEIVVVHRDAILFANSQFASLIGVDRSELTGRALDELVAPEFAEFLQDTLRRHLRSETAAERFEVEIVGFQAQFSRLELNVRHLDWEGGTALLLTGVEILPTAQLPALQAPADASAVYDAQHADASRQSQAADAVESHAPAEDYDADRLLDAEQLELAAEAALGAEEAEALVALPADVDDDSPDRLTLESIAEAIVTTDTAGRIEYVNPAGERLLGSPASLAVGHSIERLLGLVDDHEGRNLLDPVMRAVASGQPVTLGRRAVTVARKDGSERTVEISAAPLRNAARRTIGAVLLLHDVTELRGIARQMSYQATHDALTGLVNRREFERRVDEAVTTARRGDGTHVLCYIDLDRFKAVNDTSGHLAGDALLREVSKLLREAVRDSDTVARLGGDEFGLLLVGCPLDKAHQIAHDVCRAIAEYRFIWKERVFNIGASIGLLELGRESGSVEESLAAADSACYMAKSQGSGNVAVYSAQEEAVARRSGDIQWLQKLQVALRDETFELYQQPIVPAVVASADGPAMEVLLRLRDENGILWQPRDFLAAAERYRLMPSIDRWVVKSTISMLGNGALSVPVSRCVTLNISGQTLGDVSFLEFVVECLDRSGVAPSQLCFEMTESAAIANLEHARRFASVLHGMGCRFALDDFGSGVGSFSNLKNLPLDFLKIDNSFTRNLARDSVNQALVAAMIKLARTLNFRVIAEGVEDNASLDYARRMGVDFVQGNVIAKAQPLSAAA